MCGIAGVMTLDGRPVPDGLAAKFKTALAHRGPDGSGEVHRDGVLLVQTRLAIIDLEGGDQPLYMASKGGTAEPMALVANGEIYNYRELRHDLHQKMLTTESDCEPPLHLYHDQGPSYVTKLRGMYAIAIHDPAEKLLVLSRDPFGIKPLYYAETDLGFVFASEPQALIKAGLVEVGINADSLWEVLQMQFSTGVDTPYRGIKRVLPGETMVVEAGRIVERYRQDYRTAQQPGAMDEEEALAKLDKAFEDSVQMHQRADVPYGMFFSGGIDSAALLAMMDRLNSDPVQAFTIGFKDGEAHDERAHAEMLAKSVGAEHRSISFGEADFWNLVAEAARVTDDPTADYAILPTLKLSKLAKEAGLKVILSGEGGDELFAGYGRYRKAARSFFLGGKQMRTKGIFDDRGLMPVLPKTHEWRHGITLEEGRWQGQNLSKLQMAQYVDIADWLPNDLLTKLDRCLMSQGVEGRVPFLDPAVARLAFQLPDKLKTNGRLGKWILRKWLEKAMPVADPFAKKRGFTVPVEAWLASQGRRLTDALGRHPLVKDLCDVKWLETMAGSDDKAVGKALWTLLFVVLWYIQNIEGKDIEGDPLAALLDYS